VTVLRYVLVHDCGTIVNPMLVDAQIQGGITQGIGAALYETVRYDAEGVPTASSFNNYTIPSSKEAVVAELFHNCTPSPFTHLGAKGAGESGVSAPPGAIASAIEDALRHLNLHLNHLPFTPSKIWTAIQAAGAAHAQC
jgi:carbon-monoxide dehydrogenase large subunit